MREIKFRGKTKEGDWVYGGFYESIFDYQKCFFIVHPELGRFEVIPQTIGQYTGLKDISGKEIYEGDIVKYYIGSNDFPIDYNAVVEFAFGQWGFFVPYYKNVKKGTYKERFSHKIVNGIGYKFIPLVDLGSETIVLKEFPKVENIMKVQYEIVGNIYDNPELIKS